MGMNKARLKLSGQTLVARIRNIAEEVPLPTRVVWRDAVPRCGPIGGVLTAFRRSRADAILFLACDMPLVTPQLLRRVLRRSRTGAQSIFCVGQAGPGFPFLIARRDLPMVQARWRAGEWSLAGVAKAARARLVPASSSEIVNVNTREEFMAMVSLPALRPRVARARVNRKRE